WHRRLSSLRIGCATDNRFARRPQVRDTHPLRFCLHLEGGLLGQVSELSVPACGAFVEYSSCNPFSPKIRGLWTHITIGPKKWGQATVNVRIKTRSVSIRSKAGIVLPQAYRGFSNVQ